MAEDLEAPGGDEFPDWDSLYRARGDEVEPNRPIFTGDVVDGLIPLGCSSQEPPKLLIVQHPCALRKDGVRLLDRILVVEVVASEEIVPSDWVTGWHKFMPLPDLTPGRRRGRNFAAHFKKPWLASGSLLENSHRMACLSQLGVNLLLQRWVHHNSRVVVPSFKFQEVSSPEYAEADIVEDWCEERVGPHLDRIGATIEAHDWLRTDSGNGKTWQSLLEDPQTRGSVERAKVLALTKLV